MVENKNLSPSFYAADFGNFRVSFKIALHFDPILYLSTQAELDPQNTIFDHLLHTMFNSESNFEIRKMSLPDW